MYVFTLWCRFYYEAQTFLSIFHLLSLTAVLGSLCLSLCLSLVLYPIFFLTTLLPPAPPNCLRSSNSRGRPDGTFFLRRKGPSLLVLTYVAVSKRANMNANTDTPGSGGGGRQHRKSSPASRTPRPLDVLGSPRGEIGRGDYSGPGKDNLAGNNTSVQVRRR